MFHFFQTLRRQPETTRQKIAFLVTLVITLVIVAIWAVSLNNHFDQTADERREGEKPFAVIGNIFRSSITDIKSLRNKQDSVFSGTTKEDTIEPVPPLDIESIDDIEQVIDELYIEEDTSTFVDPGTSLEQENTVL